MEIEPHDIDVPSVLCFYSRKWYHIKCARDTPSHISYRDLIITSPQCEAASQIQHGSSVYFMHMCKCPVTAQTFLMIYMYV